MLSSTNRYVMYAISLVLGVACLVIGLSMKYGVVTDPIEYVELPSDSEISIESVSMDSIYSFKKLPALFNPD